jgi:ketosteroid isomerase-like protein
MVAETATDISDETILKQLNQEYVDAFMNADVEWYREHLLDDFEAIESDGSVLTKAEFLSNTAKGPDIVACNLDEVRVRIYDSVALVRATGSWTGKNGCQGLSRYTDVYVKTEGGWKTVAAQTTRTAKSESRGPYKQPK